VTGTWHEAQLVLSLACRLAVLAGCVFLVSACGGGGGSVAPQTSKAAGTPVTKPTAGPQGFTPVSFSIALAQSGTASNARRPMFVPASTTTVSVAVNGTTPVTFPCVGTSCSGTFSAPAGGSVNFVFTALDSQARPVSEASFAQTINANGANTLNVTLEGVVDSAGLALSAPGLVSYQSGSATVTANAFDVDSEPITGTYFQPISLSVNDTTGTITFPVGTLAGSTSTGTVAYTFSNATQYMENHVTIRQASPTETRASAGIAFEVGRTFYTFTSANTIVGFTPGATTATRTVTMPTLQSVSNLTCDGSNLYLSDSDDGEGTVYGLGPTATSPVTYTNTISGPNWVAANYGLAPSTYAQMYIANSFGTQAVVGFEGTPGAPPFPLPPDTPVQGGGGPTSRGALALDPAGNVYASLGGYSYEGTGGYEVRNPALTSVIATGTDGTSYSSDLIAIDTTVSPPRIYIEGFNANYDPEVEEFDNYASTPTYVSSDSNDTGLFVDSTGAIYTSQFVVEEESRVRKPGRGATGARRRTLAGTGNSFDVYAPGGLAGAVQYTIPGESLAIDSQNYVYALQDNGSINIYAPGSALLVQTIPGTNFGLPSPYSFAFGTFCR
jgi:hypothetical protein